MAQKSRLFGFQLWMDRLFRRNALRRSIADSVKTPKDRKIRFEPLEDRQLLAGDFFSATSNAFGDSREQSPIAETGPASFSSTENERDALNLIAEGESANDLVAFAQALTDAGVRLFSAAFSSFATEQRELFEDGGQFLPIIEVTNPDRSINSIGINEGITVFPTWEFQDGTRVTGVQTLEQISQLSGIAIPQSSNPFFVDIPEQTVQIGSPLHIPIDAYDPNGNDLTITVSSSNPQLISAEVLQGNRSIVFDVEDYGDLVFELFEGEAERATNRIIELAESGFYDRSPTNAVPFHRIINNFVIQGGDPTGTGAGGSSLGDFDDDFDVDLQHNRTGVLSFAKAGDDTNDSQFFITEGPQRSLDFQHSVFGQLIEGEDIRAAISDTATNGADRPINNIFIDSVSVFQDNENGLVRLTPQNGQTGTATITVTVADTEGNQFQRTFDVNVVEDTEDSFPFLDDIVEPIQAQPGVPTQFTLTAQDVEGDPPVFEVAKVNQADPFDVSINSATGLVTVTPEANASGNFELEVRVRPQQVAFNRDSRDIQRVTINVANSAPTSIDLVAGSDTGASSSDNITNASSLTFTVQGTEAGALVELVANGNVIGSATASGPTTSVTTSNLAALGNATFAITARQVVNNETSASSTPLSVTFDSEAPNSLDTSAIPTTLNAGQQLSVDLSHPEEASGLTYAIENAPAGVTIDSATGLLQWTPTESQIGANSFDIVITDLAGNTTTVTQSIDVTETARIAITTRIVNQNGDEITAANIGDIFILQLFVSDVRTENNEGVFAAYADVLFDSGLVSPFGDDPIGHGTTFTSGQTGTVQDGLIDELGGFAGTLTPVGAGPLLLAEVTLQANAFGNAVFNLNAPDDPNNEFLFFNDTDPVSAGAVSFTGASLAIGLDFTVTDDTVSADEDSTGNIFTVLDNDTIDAGSSSVLTIQSIDGLTSGGTATIATDGQSIIYTPASNFNGEEQFTYTVQNQSGVTDTATVTVLVQPVNDPPIARNDEISVASNSTENFITVLSNDDDGVDDNETLTVTSVQTPPQGGQARVGNSGTVVIYTPPAGFTGTDSFTYTISDGNGGTATGTITVNVGNVVPPPTAVADAFTINEDDLQAAFDVLANDVPSETGETLSIGTVSASSGTVTVSTADGQILYTPAPDFNGTATVTYQLIGSLGGSTTGTATFTIQSVNDDPTAVNDSLNAVASTQTELDVLANDTNVDTGETLTISAVTQPAAGQGTVSISANNNSILYDAPNPDFVGTVTFTYTVSDGNGGSDTATVTLEVANFETRSFTGTVSAPAGVDMSGVNLRLVGTDVNGNAVDQVIEVSGTSFETPEVLPGSYRIEVPQSPFLIGESSGIEIESLPSDGDLTLGEISLGEIDAQYIDIRDFLGRTLGRGFSAGFNEDGSGQFIRPFGDFAGQSSLAASLSDDGATLDLVSNDQTAPFNTSIPLNDPSSIEVRAVVDNQQLIRVSQTFAAASGLSTSITASSPVISPNDSAPADPALPIPSPFSALASSSVSSELNDNGPSTVAGDGEGEASEEIAALFASRPLASSNESTDDSDNATTSETNVDADSEIAADSNQLVTLSDFRNRLRSSSIESDSEETDAEESGSEQQLTTDPTEDSPTSGFFRRFR